MAAVDFNIKGGRVSPRGQRIKWSLISSSSCAAAELTPTSDLPWRLGGYTLSPKRAIKSVRC